MIYSTISINFCTRTVSRIIKLNLQLGEALCLTNPDLLLNFIFKLYHKTCEQFYRNFGIYEKSPNSFLPGLPRSIINQFRFHNFPRLCLASIHLPYPHHPIFNFPFLGMLYCFTIFLVPTRSVPSNRTFFDHFIPSVAPPPCSLPHISFILHIHNNHGIYAVFWNFVYANFQCRI